MRDRPQRKSETPPLSDASRLKGVDAFPRVAEFLAALRWASAIGIFLWGLFVFDLGSRNWMVVSGVLFSVPLLLQRFGPHSIRVFSLWAGFLLAAQATIPVLFHLFPPALRKNVPYLNYPMDYVTKLSLPGMHGLQLHSTDEKGFRVTHKVDYARKSGFRIVAVGASTTACDFLDDHKTWAALLEKRLGEFRPGKSLEVINTGVDGSRIGNQYATLRDVIPYRPDLVIFLLGVNDWNYHIKDTFGTKHGFKRELFKLKYSPLVSVAEGLFRGNQPVGPTIASGENILVPAEKGQVGVSDPLATLRKSLTKRPQYEFLPDRVSPDFARYLGKTLELCREKRIHCLFLTQPSAYSPDNFEQHADYFWMTPFLEDYSVSPKSLMHLQKLYNQYLIEAVAASRSSVVLDLARAIPPSFEDFYDDVHFTEKGAQGVADAVFEGLTAHAELLTPAPF